jgi:transcriptional regulator with XRE-family HTH domain
MLSKRLKQLRDEINLTQEELAKLLNLSRGTYAHYELGKRQPDYDTLMSIANFFEVSVDYLLGNSDSRNSNTSDEIVTKAFSLKEGVTELPQEALDQIDEYIRLMKLKYKK